MLPHLPCCLWAAMHHGCLCATIGEALGLLWQDFLERRLQTLVFKLGLAKSIHHARVLIRQRHIRCGSARGGAPAGWLSGQLLSQKVVLPLENGERTTLKKW